ncbi:rab-GTPase-TBC domain-containing protein [Melampsora americana]|nr:rab-GTPase-TBC domain-containing protein [Melampsora americana]
MRESRNKKKRQAKETKTSALNVISQESLISRLKDAQEPLPIKIDVESSSIAMTGADVSSELTANPEPASDKVGDCDDAELQGESEDQEPVVTTALPIKSQNDVEAELASLRESLGLPPAPSKSNAGSSPEKVNHLIIDASSSSKDETPNESIRRLLSQLNEMQEALERNQLLEWNEFISKRKARSIKTLMSVSHHHHTSPSITTGTPGEVSSIIRGASGAKGTSDPVSPESVGAFLGFRKLSETAPAGTAGMKSHATGSSASTHNAGAMSGLANEATRKDSERDLMICHDENLIGIASMGLSQDSKSVKEDWKEFRGLVTKGVPISLRPKIWLECSGANEMKEPGYYYDLLDCHKDEKGMALNQIECDVTRTLPTNVYFGGDGPGVKKLRRVLAAMSWHNPVVGYCQGMNMVAATLLLTIPNEEDAFWILVCIVDKILPSEYYTSHLLSSQADQRVLKDLVEKYLPELWEHFEGMEVELAAITFGWFLSLFADALPIQTLLRVFDLFLIDGSLILFRVAMSLLKMHRDEILSHDSPASLYAYMRGRMTLSSHHADRLIKVAVEEFGEVKNKEITRLREKYVTELKKEMGLDEGQ